MSDRFDALDELENDDEPDDSSTEETVDEEPDVEATGGSDRDHSDTATPSPSSVSEDDTDSSAPDEDASIDEPAFKYNESNQGPIYARPETWEDLDDTFELEVERHLRDRDVRNAQKRELHDAMLQLAIEEPERVAEILIETRRES